MVQQQNLKLMCTKAEHCLFTKNTTCILNECCKNKHAVEYKYQSWNLDSHKLDSPSTIIHVPSILVSHCVNHHLCCSNQGLPIVSTIMSYE